jgi:hypothetical protein
MLELEERDAPVNNVTVVFEDISSADARAAAETEKERKRQQNALPEWHQRSTIVQGNGLPVVEKKRTAEVALVEEDDSRDEFIDVEMDDVSQTRSRSNDADVLTPGAEDISPDDETGVMECEYCWRLF